jgi:hypothetical protein
VGFSARLQNGLLPCVLAGEKREPAKRFNQKSIREYRLLTKVPGLHTLLPRFIKQRVDLPFKLLLLGL